MPWKIVKRNGRHCVMKETTGQILKCYVSREKALAYQRALYASEGGGKKTYKPDPKPTKRKK